MTINMRTIEYYRLWAGNAGDGGTWDTAVINIPVDMPEHLLETAVREAVAKIKWRCTPPVLVGLYYAPEPEPEPEQVQTIATIVHVIFNIGGWVSQDIQLTDRRYAKKTGGQLAKLFEKGILATTIHNDGVCAVTEVRTDKVVGYVLSTKDETTYQDFEVHEQEKEPG